MHGGVVIQEGSGRRRRWTAEAKGRIVALTLAPGVKVSDVAREHDLSPQHLSSGDARPRRGSSCCLLVMIFCLRRF